MARAKTARCAIESDGKNLFVVFNGVRIARRGYPGSPQARTWVSLEPGYRVLDSNEGVIVPAKYP
jgi:hypothetical protein